MLLKCTCCDRSDALVTHWSLDLYFLVQLIPGRLKKHPHGRYPPWKTRLRGDVGGRSRFFYTVVNPSNSMVAPQDVLDKWGSTTKPSNLDICPIYAQSTITLRTGEPCPFAESLLKALGGPLVRHECSSCGIAQRKGAVRNNLRKPTNM